MKRWYIYDNDEQKVVDFFEASDDVIEKLDGYGITDRHSDCYITENEDGS